MNGCGKIYRGRVQLAHDVEKLESIAKEVRSVLLGLTCDLDFPSSKMVQEWSIYVSYVKDLTKQARSLRSGVRKLQKEIKI